MFVTTQHGVQTGFPTLYPQSEHAKLRSRLQPPVAERCDFVVFRSEGVPSNCQGLLFYDEPSRDEHVVVVCQGRTVTAQVRKVGELNATFWPGESGSPIFSKRNGQFTFLGIVLSASGNYATGESIRRFMDSTTGEDEVVARSQGGKFWRMGNNSANADDFKALMRKVENEPGHAVVANAPHSPAYLAFVEQQQPIFSDTDLVAFVGFPDIIHFFSAGAYVFSNLGEVYRHPRATPKDPNPHIMNVGCSIRCPTDQTKFVHAATSLKNMVRWSESRRVTYTDPSSPKYVGNRAYCAIHCHLDKVDVVAWLKTGTDLTATNVKQALRQLNFRHSETNSEERHGLGAPDQTLTQSQAIPIQNGPKDLNNATVIDVATAKILFDYYNDHNNQSSTLLDDICSQFAKYLNSRRSLMVSPNASTDDALLLQLFGTSQSHGN